MVSSDTIVRRLEDALPGAEVEVLDMTGTSDHFEAVVVAPQFEGLSRIEQHRRVYAALGELMSGAIHALKLETRAKTKTADTRGEAEAALGAEEK